MARKSAGAAQVQQSTAPVPAQTIRFTTPVVETPGVFLLTGWLWRFLRFVCLLPVHYPVMVSSTVASAVVAYVFGWVGLAVAWSVADAGLLVWWRRRPVSFRRCVGLRVLAAWRRIMVYRRHWQPVLVVAGLAESYLERQYLPQIRGVTCSEWADRVRVKIVAGTSPADFEPRVAELAHGFGAPSCRVEVRGPRDLVLEFPRRARGPGTGR